MILWNATHFISLSQSCQLSSLHKHLVSARKFQTKIRAFVNLNTFHLSLSILPALTSTQTFGQCQKILEKIRPFVNLNTFYLSLSIMPSLSSSYFFLEKSRKKSHCVKHRKFYVDFQDQKNLDTHTRLKNNFQISPASDVIFPKNYIFVRHNAFCYISFHSFISHC